MLGLWVRWRLPGTGLVRFKNVRIDLKIQKLYLYMLILYGAYFSIRILNPVGVLLLSCLRLLHRLLFT